MIGWLEGEIRLLGEDQAILNVSGVGYRVFLSARLLAQVKVGQAVQLFIETSVREDHIHLYGFAAEAEQQLYRQLTRVQGVGPRLALAVLSTLRPEEIVLAIAAEDKATLSQVSGVGAKVAARMIAELKDKLGEFPQGSTPFTAPAMATALESGEKSEGSAASDAVLALVRLGYTQSQAFAAVSQAKASVDPDDFDALLRSALQSLAS